jgi:hypothetical protein
MESDSLATERRNPTLARITRYPADGRMPAHADARSHLSVVLAGRVSERSGRCEADHEALGVAIKSADARHATRFGPQGARILSIDLVAI